MRANLRAKGMQTMSAWAHSTNMTKLNWCPLSEQKVPDATSTGRLQEVVTRMSTWDVLWKNQLSRHSFREPRPLYLFLPCTNPAASPPRLLRSLKMKNESRSLGASS